MERQRVISSNIKAIGYDVDTMILEVEFAGGRVYEYRGVMADEHSALIEAESIGAHFARTIKPRFTGTRKLEVPNDGEKE